MSDNRHPGPDLDPKNRGASPDQGEVVISTSVVVFQVSVPFWILHPLQIGRRYLLPYVQTLQFFLSG